MLGIVILILLLLAFYEGARRGLAYQFVYIVTFLCSFLIANAYYLKLAKSFELYVPYMSVTASTKMVFFSQEQSFDLDQSFYAVLAFFLILFAGWAITKIIAIFFSGLRYLKPLGKYEWIISGLLNVFIIYSLIFLGLFILALFPIDTIQQLYKDGTLAHQIFKNTPFLSDYFYQQMITNIIG